MVSLNSKKFLLISLFFILLLFVVLIASVARMFAIEDSPENITSDVASQDVTKLLSAPEVVGMAEEEYLEEVSKVAEVSDTLIIGQNCEMNPKVIEMSEGGMLNVKNEDSVERVIAFEDENFFAVSPGDMREIDVTSTFGKGEGVYRYRCGDIEESSNVGVMYIVSNQ